MKNVFLVAITVVLLTSCASHKTTMGEKYSQMYEEKPTTVVVMPPINQTTHAEAKDYFYSTLYESLCEKGYYVYPSYLTLQLFQQESAYDAEMFLENDLSAFRNMLGADAAMFTIIKKWKRNNAGGKITVEIEYILRSTKTGETLYTREGNIKLDTSVSGGSGGLLGAAINLAATALSTALTDKVIAGRVCNIYVLSDLPAGKYSPSYEKDAGHEAGKSPIKATVKAK